MYCDDKEPMKAMNNFNNEELNCSICEKVLDIGSWFWKSKKDKIECDECTRNRNVKTELPA